MFRYVSVVSFGYDLKSKRAAIVFLFPCAFLLLAMQQSWQCWDGPSPQPYAVLIARPDFQLAQASARARWLECESTRQGRGIHALR